MKNRKETKEGRIRNMLKRNKGITLIALVITIIVLLILAGVSIAMLTGENGILTQAQRAKNETEKAEMEEQNTLEQMESYLNSITGENTEFKDSLGNIVKVPAGFTVINKDSNVEDGIVIKDVSYEGTIGSEFVWIPVGTIHTSSGDKTIKLGRYVFNEDGSINEELSTEEPSYQLKLKSTNDTYFVEGLKGEETSNVSAKDIEEFVKSTKAAGGYYIGRYEARTEKERTSENDELQQVTLKENDYIYNYVSQEQAAKLSQNMYNSSGFTSDLVNSFAWDTAIVFLQECDNRGNKPVPYSMTSSVNNTFANKGTNNTSNQDKICNIFDIASNCYEWETEYSNNITYGPCTIRGDASGETIRYSSSRTNYWVESGDVGYTFRPILYF